MVEWLEWLCCGAESHRKREFEAGLRYAMTGNSLCQRSSKWEAFLNSGMIRHRKKRDGLPFHQLCPRYSGTLTPTAPTAIRLWATFTYPYCGTHGGHVAGFCALVFNYSC